MNNRRVLLTISVFLLFSVVPVGAQKNKVTPPTVNTEAQRKEKAKKSEAGGNVLKGWADSDVSYIISDIERTAFKKLTTDEERESFIENFWLRRDPSPDTPENEFRDEYYERIDYANDHFTSGVAGMRTDRGRMYILNGPPDEIDATHPTGGTYVRPQEEGGGTTNVFPFETWRYRHIDNKGDDLIYEFVDLSSSGEYSLQYDPGAKDALKNVPGMGLTDYEAATGTDKSERTKKANQLTSALSPDLPADYTKNRQFDMLDKYNDAFKPPEVKYSDIILTPAQRLSTAVLPFKVQAHYIKVTADEVRTLITVEITTKHLAFQGEAGAMKASATVTGAIYNGGTKRVANFSYPVNLVYPTEKVWKESQEQPNIFQEIKYLPPGSYKLHLTVEDKQSKNVGMTDYLLTVPRVPDQVLQASSMILAYSVTDLPPRTVATEMFALGDKKVKPNISGVFRRDQSLNIWQEFYGLTVDPTTHKPSATYEMTISQNKKELKKVVTESTELAGSGQQMKYTASVPLQDFTPGQYDVQVKVTDNLSKESFVAPGKFTVASSPAGAIAAVPAK